MSRVAVEPIHGEEDLGFIHRWLSRGAFGASSTRVNMEMLRAGLGTSRVILGLARSPGEVEPVGFVRLDLGPEEAEISLFVEKGARRGGIGRSMFAWAREQAGPRRIYAMISADNYPAGAFFNSLEFNTVAAGPKEWVRWEKGAD